MDANVAFHSSSSSSSWMAVYGAWLLLGQSIFLTLTYCYIFLNNFRILLRFGTTKVGGRLGAAATPALIIHIIIWLLLAGTSIIGNGYLVAFWRPENIYNKDWYFWTNVWDSTLAFATPLAASFLSLDRCLIIQLNPLRYQKFKKPLSVFYFSTCLISASSMLVVYIYTRNYQNLNVCWSFGCLMTSTVQQIHIIYKLILSFIHLITAIICFYILHKFNSTATGNRSKIGESIVIFTIFAEILSDTLPHFLSFIVVNLLNINLNAYLGSYLRIAICLDGFLCSWKYSTSLQPLFNNPSRISKTEVSTSRISHVTHVTQVTHK